MSMGSLFGNPGGFSGEMDYLRRMVEGLDNTGKTAPEGEYKETGLGSAMRIEMNVKDGFDATAQWLRKFGFKQVSKADWDVDSDDEDAASSSKPEEIAMVAEAAAFILSSRPAPPIVLGYISDDFEGRLEVLRRANVEVQLHTDRECSQALAEERTKAVLEAVDARVAERKVYINERRKLLAEIRKEEAEAKAAREAAGLTEGGGLDEGAGGGAADGSAMQAGKAGAPSASLIAGASASTDDPAAPSEEGAALSAGGRATGGEGGEAQTTTVAEQGGEVALPRASPRRKLPPARQWERLLLPSVNGLSFTAPGGLRVCIRRTRVHGTGVHTSPLPGYELDKFNEADNKAFDELEAQRKVDAASLWVGLKEAGSLMTSSCRRGGSASAAPVLGYENEDELLTFAGVIVPLKEGEDMEVAIKFWKRLGFDMHSMDNEPQDYGVVSDGQVVLAYLPDGHTSCPALPSPGLLYTTSECGKVERRMKAAGLLATGRKAAPPRDKKDEDSGRVFTLAVPSVHNPTTNKQGELVTCVTPGGVPVVMASNPESKFALYVVAGCALLFFLLLGVVAFAVATSDQARGLLGNILMWIISGGKQGRMGGGGTFAGPSEEAWQRLRDLDPDLARRAARAARS